MQRDTAKFVESAAPRMRAALEADALLAAWENQVARGFHLDYVYPTTFLPDTFTLHGDQEGQRKLAECADRLNNDPSVLPRIRELETQGLHARVVIYSESGGDHLSVFVKIDERGRETLARLKGKMASSAR